MAVNKDMVVGAYNALAKADEDFEKTKKELKKVANERSYFYVAMKKEYTPKNVENAVKSDSSYAYLLKCHADAYYRKLKAQKLVCQILNKGSKIENQLQASIDSVWRDLSQLDSCAYEIDDRQPNVMQAKEDDSLWRGQEMDVKLAEDYYGKIANDGKKNKRLLQSLSNEFDKYLSENYPTLKR